MTLTIFTFCYLSAALFSLSHHCFIISAAHERFALHHSLRTVMCFQSIDSTLSFLFISFRSLYFCPRVLYSFPLFCRVAEFSACLVRAQITRSPVPAVVVAPRVALHSDRSHLLSISLFADVSHCTNRFYRSLTSSYVLTPPAVCVIEL